MKSLHLSTHASALAAASLALASMAFPATAQESTPDRLWSEALSEVTSCGTAFNATLSEGSRCLFSRSLNMALEEGTRLANDYGRQTFGEHFQVVSNLTYSPVSGQTGLRGALDMVLPLSQSESLAGGVSTSAIFFQQGFTRWWDGSGALHNDLRNGLVYRFRVSDRPDADVVGVSMLHLVNAEQRHQVLVSVIDYAGAWGTGAFRYFSPTTDWRPDRLGYEVKALEGMELMAGVDVTSTLGVSTTGYRWEAADGSGQWNEGVRLDVRWRPHPWLDFGVGYDRLGEADGALSLFAGLRVPLGSPTSPPRWEGLGVAAGGSAPDSSSLWRPIEGVGPIRVATRQTPASLVAEAEVRFLEDAVESGNTVQVEVVLPAAAPENMRVSVRLVPGTGDHPAVAGEDYVDQAVEATIAEGSTTAQVSFRLLLNDALRENRSLGATVTLVS